MSARPVTTRRARVVRTSTSDDEKVVASRTDRYRTSSKTGGYFAWNAKRSPDGVEPRVVHRVSVRPLPHRRRGRGRRRNLLFASGLLQQAGKHDDEADRDDRQERPDHVLPRSDHPCSPRRRRMVARSHVVSRSPSTAEDDVREDRRRCRIEHPEDERRHDDGVDREPDRDERTVDGERDGRACVAISSATPLRRRSAASIGMPDGSRHESSLAWRRGPVEGSRRAVSGQTHLDSRCAARSPMRTPGCSPRCWARRPEGAGAIQAMKSSSGVELHRRGRRAVRQRSGRCSVERCRPRNTAERVAHGCGEDLLERLRVLGGDGDPVSDDTNIAGAFGGGSSSLSSSATHRIPCSGPVVDFINTPG